MRRFFSYSFWLLIACACAASTQIAAQAVHGFQIAKPVVQDFEPPYGPETDAHPSFECRPSVDPIEVAICSDKKLAAADAELATVYISILSQATADQRPGLISDQRVWLKSRFAQCGGGRERSVIWCLEAAYKDRLPKLKDRADELGIRARLKHGQSAVLGESTMHCQTDSVGMTFEPLDDENGNGPAEIPGKRVVVRPIGTLETTFADCQMQDGTSIRIKTGLEYGIQAWGECGGAPPYHLSIWVNRRLAVSDLEYESVCGVMVLSTVEVTRHSARLCLQEGQESPLALDKLAPPVNDKCRTIYFGKALPLDSREFPPAGSKERPIGSFVLRANGKLAHLCSSMVPQHVGDPLALPAGTRFPDWEEVRVQPTVIDEAALGYNATTMSAMTSVGVAKFDLFNSGKAERVYEADSSSHWFDGTAFAIDRGGILSTPFDAHDWAASVIKGVYPFVYDDTGVFFFEGKTFLMLNPVNDQTATTIISLQEDGTQTQECVFEPVTAHF